MGRTPRIFVCLLLFVFVGLSQADAAIVGRFYSLSGDQVAEYVMRDQARKKIVFIYASWCGFCRAEMPRMMALEDKNPGAIVAISIDENPQDLVNYLEKFDRDIPFPVVLWSRQGDLIESLQSTGVSPTSGIPYMAFIDESGTVIRQGNISGDDAEEFLQ